MPLPAPPWPFTSYPDAEVTISGDVIVDDVAVSALPVAVTTDIETSADNAVLIKTAVEALAALISGGSLKAILTAGSAAIGKLSANAGVTIGGVENVPPSVGFNGAISVTTGTSSVFLHDSGNSHALRVGIRVTCLPTSPGSLFVSIANGSAAADITATGDIVLPGTTGVFAIDNTSKVTVGASAASSLGRYSAS